MPRYLLSIGSNCPDCEAMMRRVESWLNENFTDVESSGIYRSEALNGTSADYLNMVVRASSPLPVTEVVESAKLFERECGRSPESKLRGCVEMDVDVIAVNSTILRPNEFNRDYFIKGYSRL